MGGERVNMNQISVILSHFVFKTTQNVDYQHNADFCWLPAQCCFCSDVKLQLSKFWYHHSALAYTLKYYDLRQPTLFLKKMSKRPRNCIFVSVKSLCCILFSDNINTYDMLCRKALYKVLEKLYCVQECMSCFSIKGFKSFIHIWLV